MAREQSEHSRYPSRYSPKGFVRSDQYIIELICEKKAKREKKDLPVKFWDSPEWANFFKSQLRKCKSLLTRYSADTIIKSLQDKRAYSIYSLHAPWLVDIIEEYHSHKSDFVPIENNPAKSGTFQRSSITTNNILDKLKDL